ncbi:MAG: hypothetical protein ABJ118_01645 [Luteolibacter sp.]
MGLNHDATKASLIGPAGNTPDETNVRASLLTGIDILGNKPTPYSSIAEGQKTTVLIACLREARLAEVMRIPRTCRKTDATYRTPLGGIGCI